MLITIQDIHSKFDDLCQGRESRESVAEFARRAMSANDIGLLERSKDNNDVIWRSILYLSGVDLKEYPGNYIHSLFDFEEARINLGV